MRTAQSSCRDRTLEFQSIADRLRSSSVANAHSGGGGGGASSSSSQPDRSRSAVSIQSEFNKRAANIGFGIHQTSNKLKKLAQLAKKTSVFDDPTVEIQELTAVIKQDITALNAAVLDLQLVCNSQNESGNISVDTSNHSTTVVDNLKNRLMSATKDFKDVLTMRTENLKIHENRRQLFSSTASKEPSVPFVRQRPLAARLTGPSQWANESSSSSSLFPKKQIDGESQPLLQQQTQQQQQLVPVQDTYMQSRAEALRNVESTIHELSNIFTQLATMVSQQGEIAIRIDENMDESLANVEGAQNQLVSIPITIKDAERVIPNGPIPVASGDTLYLSNLDDMVGCRVLTPTVYFYHCNGGGGGGGGASSYNGAFKKPMIMEILKDALATVLVPYYPFSGRLRATKNEKLEVFFGPGQGAIVVEAHTPMAIADLGDLAVPNTAWLPLIYYFPDESPYKVIDMPLMIAQVTQFSCGGFSLGLRLCHCLCDGLGAMQFLNAWASTARVGTLVASPKPCWDREFFRPREPPCITTHPHVEFMSFEDTSSLTRSLWQPEPVQKCYKVCREFQLKIKTLAQGPCSGFEAMAAHVWRSWVKALDVKPLDFELRLTFAVNMRRILKNPPLRDGYYGNAFCIACATSTVRGLVEGPLSDTARLVHEARLRASEEYLRSTVDYLELNRQRRLEFAGKLAITQWTRFSMYESADFGWGSPAYAGPFDLTKTPQVCLFLPLPEREKISSSSESDRKMLVCICLPETATAKFKDFFSLNLN
ncbi:hypothetical protein Dimus_034431 [Dionaea muscipula]